MNFKPLHHYVQVEATPEKSWRVLAVGPGYFDPFSMRRVPMPVKVGDLVFLDDKQLVKIQHGSIEVVVVPETGIYGIDRAAKK